MIRAIWKEYTESQSSVTDESAAGTLTSGEVAALLRLAQTAFERQVLQKILALVRLPCRMPGARRIVPELKFGELVEFQPACSKITPKANPGRKGPTP